jgi:hypothetical protein
MKGTISLLATVVAVALTGTTLAAERPNDRSGLQGVGAVAEQDSAPTRPDDRPGARGPDAAAAPSQIHTSRPDDRAGPRRPGQLSESSSVSAPPSVTVVVSRGFDWADAAIGALGAALIAVGLAVAATRLRHYKHASAQ